MERTSVRFGTVWFLVVSVMCATGCKSLGPGTVPRDRSDYSAAIAESWKRQTLLNIVKLRYVDPPVFVDVGQIVAGYSMETSVSAGAGWDSDGSVGLFSGAAKFTDRPTVTYSPLTGDDFIRGLMTPVPPESVFFMIEAGYPADGVLLGMVSSLNGLKNQQVSVAGVAPPDPKFLRVLSLLRQIQLAGAVSLRIQTDRERGATGILTIHRDPHVSPEVAEAGRELRELLRLDAEATEFKLVFAASPADSKELAVLSRSLLQLMSAMAAQVDVPPEHLADGRAVPGWESAGETPGPTRLIQVHSGKSKPKDATVAVQYRGHWFWINDRDLRSKHSFALIMMMFTLANSNPQGQLPLITIPAQ